MTYDMRLHLYQNFVLGDRIWHVLKLKYVRRKHYLVKINFFSITHTSLFAYLTPALLQGTFDREPVGSSELIL